MPSADQLLKKFSNIKTLPHTAMKLSKMISEDKSSMEDFEAVIKLDPTLVLRILKMVNSPYYALRNKVSSISEAVVYIGMESLRNMITVEALKDIFSSSTGSKYFSRPHLWMHCAAVSICSQMISEQIFGKNGDDAFLCGILHDIGMVVEDQLEHDLFFSVCSNFNPETDSFTKKEMEIIGTNHCLIGSQLSAYLKFPAEVQDGIKFHHKKSENFDPSSIAGIIKLAHYMVERLNYNELPGLHEKLPQSLMVHIKKNIDEYKFLAEELPNEMAKAKEIYQVK